MPRVCRSCLPTPLQSALAERPCRAAWQFVPALACTPETRPALALVFKPRVRLHARAPNPWGSVGQLVHRSRVEIVRRALEFSACASAVSCGPTSGIHPWHVSRAWRGSAARRPRVLKLRAGVYRIRVCLGCMSILPPPPRCNVPVWPHLRSASSSYLTSIFPPHCFYPVTSVLYIPCFVVSPIYTVVPSSIGIAVGVGE